MNQSSAKPAYHSTIPVLLQHYCHHHQHCHCHRHCHFHPIRPSQSEFCRACLKLAASSLITVVIIKCIFIIIVIVIVFSIFIVISIRPSQSEFCRACLKLAASSLPSLPLPSLLQYLLLVSYRADDKVPFHLCPIKFHCGLEK